MDYRLSILLGFVAMTIQVESNEYLMEPRAHHRMDSTPLLSRLARQATRTTTPPPVDGIMFLIPNCNCVTTSEFNPVCGSNRVSYQNRQRLECHARCGENVEFRRLGICTG